MAKRLHDVCALPESKPLWRAGRGFVVRDLPWTVEKLRAIPPFEFENWAVITLGGIPNQVEMVQSDCLAMLPLTGFAIPSPLKNSCDRISAGLECGHA